MELLRSPVVLIGRDRMVRIEAAKALSPVSAFKAMRHGLRRLWALARRFRKPVSGDIYAGADDDAVDGFCNAAVLSWGCQEIAEEIFRARSDDPCTPALIATFHLRRWVLLDSGHAGNADGKHQNGDHDQADIQLAEISHRFKHPSSSDLASRRRGLEALEQI